MNTDEKQTIRYIGNFPPPYGGVTIKNDLLLKKLSNYFSVKTIHSNSRIRQLLWLIGSVFTKNKMIIGVSSTTGKTLLLTKLLYHFNRNVMRKSLYFMMGGVESERIASNSNEVKMYSNYRKIYVEIESMKDELEEAGLRNIEIYPNCREFVPFDKCVHDGFKIVYFSLISGMKGADMALQLAVLNPEIEVDFYGQIDKSYRDEFERNISHIPNASYKGIFESNKKNVFRKLSEYDVLVFPTRCKTEGIPGVLAEAKLAGIPAVVSDVAYNSQIVNDYSDGIVIKNNSLNELNNAINELAENEDLLNKMKLAACKSGEKYNIDNYIDMIVTELS